jgi:cytochrome P450
MFRLPPPVDLVSAFSFPFAFTVICDKLGAPADDEAFLRGASRVVASRSSYDHTEVDRAFAEMFAYFERLAAVKRSAPGDDVMTALVTAHDDERSLSHDEMIEMAVQLLVVGHDTSASMVALFVLALLEHPSELSRLRADPSLVPNALEELLRFVPLSDGAGALVRVAREDTVLGDQAIAAGDAVIPALPAANRDPARYPEPECLDLGRSVTKTLAFGGGHHFCLGAALARIELQEALAALVAHMPDGLHLAVDHSALRADPAASVRRLREFPLSW